MIRAIRSNPVVEAGEYQVSGPQGVETFRSVFPEQALYAYADKHHIQIFVDLQGWIDYTPEFQALHAEMIKAPRRLHS